MSLEHVVVHLVGQDPLVLLPAQKVLTELTAVTLVGVPTKGPAEEMMAHVNVLLVG